MSIDKLMRKMNYASRGNVWHLYWPYQRRTLCGVSKVDRPTSLILVPPVCPECAAVLIELSLEKEPV